ncbi:MAG: chemotaxis protein CheC [Candidatus Omnitrophota bacterium]
MKLSEVQKSALLEAGNIGAGHAAIALSQLMGKKIMIAIPSIEILETSDVSGVMGGGDKTFIQVCLKVLGDAEGIMVFTIEDTRAMTLCDVVMGQAPGTTKILGEIEQSAMKEVGSIVASSYLNALSEMTGLSLLVSTPEYNAGCIAALDRLLRRKGGENDVAREVMCIKTEFVEAANKIEGYLVLMPAAAAIKTILDALRV